MSIITTILVALIVSGTMTKDAPAQDKDALTGAWETQVAEGKEVMVMQDGYCTITRYDVDGKKFFYSKGGRYSINNDVLTVDSDFHSGDKAQASKKITLRFSVKGDQLTLKDGGQSQVWKLVDNKATDITGSWRINGRVRDGVMSEMRPGARKTLKILSGTRFQWFAINTDTNEFFGTGGGTYTLEDGKYTEKIEFFSRDGSRVGASLSFDAKVEDGVWHHSGLSSKGDPIHETWVRYNGQ
jgi:hypothetical protein